MTHHPEPVLTYPCCGGVGYHFRDCPTGGRSGGTDNPTSSVPVITVPCEGSGLPPRSTWIAAPATPMGTCQVCNVPYTLHRQPGAVLHQHDRHDIPAMLATAPSGGTDNSTSDDEMVRVDPTHLVPRGYLSDAERLALIGQIADSLPAGQACTRQVMAEAWGQVIDLLSGGTDNSTSGHTPVNAARAARRRAMLEAPTGGDDG